MLDTGYWILDAGCRIPDEARGCFWKELRQEAEFVESTQLSLYRGPGIQKRNKLPQRLRKSWKKYPRVAPCRNRNGYTLIELIVVMVLIGLMLAVGVPRFQGALLTDDLKLTTRQIIGLVRGLRNKAIQEQQRYYLHLDLENNAYWIDSGADGEEQRDLARQNAVKLAEEVRIIDVWSRTRGKQAVGEAVIRFSAKGYVDQTAIHLGAADDRQLTMVLAPFLGTVEIHDKYVDIGN